MQGKLDSYIAISRRGRAEGEGRLLLQVISRGLGVVGTVRGGDWIRPGL